MHRLKLLLLLALCACSSRKSVPDHDTDLKCVNSFIRCLYEGRFDEAERIMVNDDAGRKCLQQAKFNYQQKMTREQRAEYKQTAVTIVKEPVNDSIVVFTCGDMISKDKKPYKVIRRNNEWLVDFSYTCSGNL